jgi:hypothetical protein
VNFACTTRRTMPQEPATAKSAGDEHAPDRRTIATGREGSARHPSKSERPGPSGSGPLGIDRGRSGRDHSQQGTSRYTVFGTHRVTV